MGGNSFSCLSDSCTKDTSSNEFSEVLSITNEEASPVPQVHGNEEATPQRCRSNSIVGMLQENPILQDNHKEIRSTDVPGSVNDQLLSESQGVSTQSVPELKSKDLINARPEQLEISSDQSSPDDNSVLSSISPTKDRMASPPRKSVDQTSFEGIVEETTSKVDKLNLHGTENEVVDDWREINTLIKAGDCRRLAAFTELHNIDLQTVRFTEHRYSPLHLAVLYDRTEMVRFLLQQGINVNIKDENGYTAIGLAYEQSSLAIIDELLNAKAQEFTGSPYSPYALSVISNVFNLRSNDKADADPLYLQQDDSPDALDNMSVRSDLASVTWSTPRVRACSTDASPPYHGDQDRRLTLNTPSSTYRVDAAAASTFRNSSAVAESVKRRMAQLAESLDKLTVRDRQRAFSLPTTPAFHGSSPSPSHVRSPTNPSLHHLVMSTALEDAHAATEQQHSEHPSPHSETAGSEGTASTSDTKKLKKPMGKRFRQAAGRALSMFNPVKGMPPRVPTGTASSRPPLPTRPSLPVHTTATATVTRSIVAETTEDSAETTAESALGTVSDGTSSDTLPTTDERCDPLPLPLSLLPLESAVCAEEVGHIPDVHTGFSLMLPSDLQSPMRPI